MTTIQIKHRFTGAVLFEYEATEDQVSQGIAMREALHAAIKARAYFAGADFAGAYFADAYFAGADFAGANFAGANFADAYFAGANFAGANFADADFAGAYFADAYFADADFAGANFADADFAGANFADAYFADADFADANFADAYFADARNVQNEVVITSPEAPYQRDTRPAAERYADRAAKFRKENPTVPVVDALDSQILSKVEANPNALEMGAWHTCETTHCRAGWAIALAGKAGFELEEKHGPQLAGRMIYIASTGRAPHFFASNENALADIKRCAALEKK